MKTIFEMHLLSKLWSEIRPNLPLSFFENDKKGINRAKSVLLLLSLGLFLASCQSIFPDEEETRIALTSQPDGVVLENGMLKFPSNEVYGDAIHFFSKNQVSGGKWDQWISKFGGFVSYSDAYSQITEEEWVQMEERQSLDGFEHLLLFRDEGNREIEVDAVIKNPFLAAIANESGMYQIGESVYKVLYTQKLMVKSPNKAQFEAFVGITEGDDLPDWVEVYKIERVELTSVGTRAGNTNCKNEYANSPKRRINSTIYWESESYGMGIIFWNTYFYSEVKNQRKSVGIWWARQADKLETTGTRETDNELWNEAWNPDLPDISFSGEKLNDNKFSLLIGWFTTQAGPGATFPVDFTADNFVEDKNNGPTGTCSTDANW